jgi:hypothetical protein
MTTLDPALLGYDPVGQIHLRNTTRPRGLAVMPDGRFVIADDQSILTDPAGSILKSLDTAGPASAVTIAPDALIAIATATHLHTFGPDGFPLRNWPIPWDEPLITSIAVGPEFVYMADARHRSVAICSRAGQLITTLDSVRFSVPSPYFDLALTDHHLFVANPGQHRIEQFDLAGSHRGSWGTPSMAIEGFCGCCNPASFKLLPGGQFITAEKGLVRVKRYSPTGTFECAVAGAQSFAPVDPAAPHGRVVRIAIDPSHRVCVLDPATGTIHLFAHRGPDVQPT